MLSNTASVTTHLSRKGFQMETLCWHSGMTVTLLRVMWISYMLMHVHGIPEVVLEPGIWGRTGSFLDIDE